MLKLIQRWSVYVVIVLAVCFLLWSMSIRHMDRPQGIFLTTQLHRYFSPTKSPITVYKWMPVDKTVIGNVNVMLHMNTTSMLQADQQMVDYAKQLASQHGATGIVMAMYYTPPSATDPLAAYTRVFTALR